MKEVFLSWKLSFILIADNAGPIATQRHITYNISLISTTIRSLQSCAFTVMTADTLDDPLLEEGAWRGGGPNSCGAFLRAPAGHVKHAVAGDAIGNESNRCYDNRNRKVVWHEPFTATD